ncbi:MAG TPA: hypothetical protein PL046_25960, partial [Polyangiaceae bacterium]|nr:hypothetical protein [Polyangiaceae bacterium]
KTWPTILRSFFPKYAPMVPWAVTVTVGRERLAWAVNVDPRWAVAERRSGDLSGSCRAKEIAGKMRR